MLGLFLVFVSCILLLVQCLGFYELIPLLSFSCFGQSSLIIYYIHACICKWGLPFAVIGLIMGIICLCDRKNVFDLKKHMLNYGIFFMVLTILSFL